jgi:hypothetical protein
LAGKAGVSALSTKDAPVGIIVDKRMVPDDGRLLEGFFKSSRFQANPQEFRDALKLASPVARTVAAFHLVDGHEEAKGALLKVPHSWRVSLHHHPFSNFNGACGRWLFQTFDFHKAKPAGSRRVFHRRQETEIRDVDPVVQAYLKKLRSFPRFNLVFIHPNLYHSMEPLEVDNNLDSHHRLPRVGGSVPF